MPIRPAPFTLTCSKCNWSHTFAPRSDTLVLGHDIETHCPSCGTEKLRRHSATLFGQLSSKLKGLMSP